MPSRPHAIFLLRLGLRRSSRGLRQCTDDGAACEFDLEGVVLESFSISQRQVRGAFESLRARDLSGQRRFGRLIPPWFVRDAAEREPGLSDRVAVHLQPNRDGHKREGIGQAIADLEIGVVLGEILGREARRR